MDNEQKELVMQYLEGSPKSDSKQFYSYVSQLEIDLNNDGLYKFMLLCRESILQEVDRKMRHILDRKKEHSKRMMFRMKRQNILCENKDEFNSLVSGKIFGE